MCLSLCVKTVFRLSNVKEDLKPTLGLTLSTPGLDSSDSVVIISSCSGL